MRSCMLELWWIEVCGPPACTKDSEWLNAGRERLAKVSESWTAGGKKPPLWHRFFIFFDTASLVRNSANQSTIETKVSFLLTLLQPPPSVFRIRSFFLLLNHSLQLLPTRNCHVGRFANEFRVCVCVFVCVVCVMARCKLLVRLNYSRTWSHALHLCRETVVFSAPALKLLQTDLTLTRSALKKERPIAEAWLSPVLYQIHVRISVRHAGRRWCFIWKSAGWFFQTKDADFLRPV